MPQPPIEWPVFTSEEFDLFRQLLQEKCGMHFDESKLSVVRTMVQERMATHNLTDYRAYYRLLLDSSHSQSHDAETHSTSTSHRALGKELRRLVEGLAVNETAFFRNKEHYRAIKEEVLPRLFRRHMKNRKIRIWSAGCSTGQEPYSLAMAAIESLEVIGEVVANWKIEIVASDISEKALRVAHNGRYRSEDMRGLGAEQIARFFRPLTAASVATAPLDPEDIYGPDRAHLVRHRPQMAFEVSPQIRELVKFYFFNLVSPVYPVDKFYGFDLVLCENVTIYFTPEVTRQVIHNIGATMNEGAFLFIGYSETLWQVSDRFKLINTQDTFYYQKPFPNEDPTRYIRHQPTTGPLSSPPGSIPPALRQTDDLHRIIPPISRNSQRVAKTDPLLQPEANSTPKAPVQPVPTRFTRPADKITDPKLPALNPPASLNGAAPAKRQTANTAAEVKDWRSLLDEGRQRMVEHDFENALAALELALVAGPSQVEVLCSMAELKLKLGDYKTATELCQKAIRIDSLAEPAHLMLAMIYHREGRIEQAIEEFKRTIYINFDSEIAHLRLGDIYRDMGLRRDALREYKHALSLLQQRGPEEIIEDLSVGLLVQACKLNIARLSPSTPNR